MTNGALHLLRYRWINTRINWRYRRVDAGAKHAGDHRREHYLPYEWGGKTQTREKVLSPFHNLEEGLNESPPLPNQMRPSRP